MELLYGNPIRYVADEETAFHEGPVLEVSQVPGFEGVHSPRSAGDELLVIGAGYDDDFITRASEAREQAKKLLLVGLPALQPHMYQESRLRIARASEALGHLSSDDRLFAPSSNPFVTAEVIHRAVERERRRSSIGNVYLCPLGPKPHVLGFAIYYLHHCLGTATSVIFPYATSYPRLTTEGLGKVWLYEVEL